MKGLLWVCAALALGAAIWFARTEPARAATVVEAAAVSRAAAAPAALEAPRPAPAPAPMPPARAEAPRVPDRALASAQTTVATQLSYLDDGQYDLFIQTFTDEVRPQVTPEVFERCRTRVHQVPVRPDWEMAEPAVESGHRVNRVSMFG